MGYRRLNGALLVAVAIIAVWLAPTFGTIASALAQPVHRCHCPGHDHAPQTGPMFAPCDHSAPAATNSNGAPLMIVPSPAVMPAPALSTYVNLELPVAPLQRAAMPPTPPPKAA